MSSRETIDVLNRVLVTLCSSFPQYLRWAEPYVPPGREKLLETLADIVTGQDALAERISDQIIAAGAAPDSGEFPMEFTDTHDLNIDFLIEEAIRYQREDVARLEELADELNLAPAAQSLAAEAVGMAKGHLESLEELRAAPPASPVARQAEPA